MSQRNTSIFIVRSLTLVAGWLTGPADLTLAAGADDEWPSYNRSLDGQRYSPLTEINADTVAGLQRVCSVRIADDASLHASPLVIDGTIYVATTHATTAIDALTCGIVWKVLYSPVDAEVTGTVRGVAVADGRLFRGTIDGHLLCYNARTGEKIWDVTLADSKLGEFVAAAPIVHEGRVFIGVAGSDWGIRGRVSAVDGRDGRVLWTFNTVPAPGEFGADTWKGTSAERGGGGTWTSYALDAARRELFVSVANPAPDMNIEPRRGADLFTNSLVVLDADDGKLKWFFQATPNDDRDQDLSAPAVLYRGRDGTDLAAVASKDGHVYGVNRKDHRRVFRTAVTTILNEHRPVGDTPAKYCPGMGGGVEWNGPAYDALDSLLIVGSVDWCAWYNRAEPRYVQGQIYYGGEFKWATDPAPSGWITALDSNSGAVVWRFHAPAPVVGGVTSTAGGVTFAGDMAGRLYAFKSADGSVLFKDATGGAIAGGISTYAIHGRQYLAVTSGNVSRQVWGVAGAPTVIVYGLAGDAAPSERVAADAERGQRVFKMSCAPCHGIDARGVSGPGLRGGRLTVEAISEQIRHPAGAMPMLYPSVLSRTDLDDVALYVSGLR